MKLLIIKYRLLLLCGFVALSVQAQEERELDLQALGLVDSTSELQLITRYRVDGVDLRWGYTNATAWKDNFREEAVIYRRQVSPNPSRYAPIGRAQILGDTELEQLAGSRPEAAMLAVVHRMAYQEWEEDAYGGSGEGFSEKVDRLNNRYTYLHFAADRDAEAAQAAGMAYTDSNIEPDVVYAYKVVTQSEEPLTALKVVRPVALNPRPIIYEIIPQDSMMTIRWERDLHERYFSAYYIDRALVSGTDWEQLNDEPYVQGYDRRIFREAPRFIAYNDLLEDGQIYKYRIRGIDAFGTVSAPSPILLAQQMDRTPPPAPILSTDEDVLTHLTKELSWVQPEGEAVVTYHLERAHADEREVLVDWARPDQRSKIDEVTEPGIYAYRLIAVDAEGNRSYSSPHYANLRDRIPPASPTGLEAVTDTSGTITLTWDAPLEEDVFGYYVYAADGDRRAYERLTPSMYRSRRFVDSVSTALLNSRRMYYVVAIDDDRLYSASSDTLEVIPPDVNPPSPALIGDFRVEAEGIRLLLVHSSSRDVEEHRLLRRKLEEETFSVLAEWEVPPTVYVDQNAEAGQAYLYAYQAIDHSGLESAIVTEIQAAMPPPPPPIPELEIESRDFRVFLSWEALEADHYLLYRSVDGGPKQRLQTLDGGAINYADARTEAGKTYTYQLRLVNVRGRKSAFSEPVSIQF